MSVVAELFVGFVAGVALTLYCARYLQAFALGHDCTDDGAAFVAELIPDDGSVHFCGCLHGNLARYRIECGPDIAGPVCLNCARAEFVAWCLRQCDKRLTRHAEEIDRLALEYNPDPQPREGKGAQP